MAAFLPTTRRINWLSASFGAVLYFLLTFGLKAAMPSLESAPLWGAGGYTLLTLVLRRTLARDHMRSIRLMRARQWEEACMACQQSFDFFESKQVLDRHRYLFLLSFSAMPYREMALTNKGFCLSQLGRHEEARTTYERVVSLFPNASIAPYALKTMGPKGDAPSESK